MADKMMRVAGRGDDGTAKAIKTDNNGNISVNIKEGVSRKVEYNNINLSSLFYGFGETRYSGGSAPESRSGFKPFQCNDLSSVIIKIQNNSAEDLAPTCQILLYNTSEDGSLPIFTVDIPRIKANETRLIRVSDNILNLEGIAVSIPKLSSFGVAYRQIGANEDVNISVSMWGVDK